MINTERIELSEKQVEYIKHVPCRWNFKIGATQCGKTWIDTQYVIPERIFERAGKPGIYLILGVTKATIERNVLEPMREIWGEDLISEISSKNIVKMFGEEVYCLGSEKVSQVKRIRGSRIKYCYIDEAVDANEEVFRFITTRLSFEYSCCDATGNPAWPTHFIKEFIDSDADVWTQTWTLYDNPFIAKSYIKSLETEYADTVYFDRYVLGKWAKAEGLIYPMFDRKLHTFGDDEAPQSGEWFISIDYGIQNPFSAGLWCVNGNTAYRMAEYYHDGRKDGQRTDEEHADAVVELAGKRFIKYHIVDPSAASFITCLNRRRLRVTKANNDVLAGIANTATALQQGRVMIHQDCTDLIQELGLYAWDTKAKEDKPLKENDHACDDMRYFVRTALRKALPIIDRRTIEDD